MNKTLHILCFVILCVFGISVVGCSHNNTFSSSKQQVSQSPSSSNQLSSNPVSKPNTIIDSQTEKTKFEQFESGLKKTNIKYKTVTMGAQLVGAEEGIKYELSDGNVELYKFNKESPAYKKAFKNKAITLDGFGDFPTKFNGDMALMFDDNVKEKADIEAAFNSIK